MCTDRNVLLQPLHFPFIAVSETLDNVTVEYLRNLVERKKARGLPVQYQ